MASLPSAALGAVVFYAAGKLVSIPDFKRLWAFRRREFMLAIIAMLGTVIIGILQGALCHRAEPVGDAAPAGATA